MVRWIAILGASSTLAGCAARDVPPAMVAPAAEPAPVVAEAMPAPKPQYGTFGFDAAGMDRSVAPGDDFYQYANGTWLKATPIPPDRSNFGAFSVLQDVSQQRVRDILDAVKGDSSSRIGMAYASFLDEAAVEAKG